MKRIPNPKIGAAASIWRIFWTLLMVAVALAAIGLELDREARRRPGLSTIVPPVFRHFAQFNIAHQALSAGENRRALAAAERLVLERPIPAEHLSLLAVAAHQNGLDRLSNRAISAAAGRGWRELIAQGAAAEAAMNAGDWEVAFYRAVALWSLDERGVVTVDALERIAANPAGRMALAGWLQESSRWRDRFVVWGSTNLDPDALADAIAFARSRQTRFDCPSLAQAAGTILSRGHPLASEKVWAGPCRQGSRLDARDFSFLPSQESEADGPFGWISTGASIFTRVGSKSDKRWRLDYETSMPGYTLIAHRYAGIKPGKYLLFVRDERGRDSPALPLRFQMNRIDQNGRQSEALATKLVDTPVIVEIPASACASQYFQLSAGRGAGSIANVVLTAPSS